MVETLNMVAMVDDATILIVADQTADLIVLEANLSRLGHRIVSASNREETVARLQHEDFAVVLLDSLMARLEGFDTARLIRETGCLAPIIFITALEFAPSEFEQAQTDRGAVDCMVKPFDARALRAKIEGYVDHYRSSFEGRGK